MVSTQPQEALLLTCALCFRMLGPRRKMTTAIARWHSEAHLCGGHLERAYADRLEAEMQEMAIQLHQVSGAAAQRISGSAGQ